MKLTRRDAIAALLAAGMGAGAVGTARRRSDPGRGQTESPLDNDRTVIAVADVIYPPKIEGIRGFVERYAAGLPESDRDGMDAAADRLDDRAMDRRGRPFAALPVEARDEVLREEGVHVAASNPDGEPAERIRYHLVNELLYALFVSPTGSRLVDVDNPVGYPGGHESYQVEP